MNVAVGEGVVWFAGGRGETAACCSGRVWGIDPGTNEVIAVVELPGRAGFPVIATGMGGVWVVDGSAAALYRIDPSTGRIAQTIVVPGLELRGAVEGLAVGRGSVWAAHHELGYVSRIDPATNEVIARIQIRGEDDELCSCSVAVGAGGVWAS